MEPVVEGSKYLVDYSAIAAYATRRKASKIAIQLPEGLRTFAPSIAARIATDTGSEVTVDADPCFGACDIPSHLFSQADLVVQFGHTEMPSIGAIPKMFFANLLLDIDPIPAVERAVPLLGSRVGLLTNAQHLHTLSSVKKFLEDSGKEVVVAMGDGRLAFPAQLLGCDYTAATRIEQDVDTFLYMGDGDFHPVGLALVTKKPVIVANPSTCSVKTVEELREKLLRQRYGAVERASSARSFGIMVSFKVGQRRPGVPEALLAELRERGREGYLIHTNVISPELVDHYALDAFICTACPRVAIDDYGRFKKPVLTPLEARIAVGIEKPEALTLDQILA